MDIIKIKPHIRIRRTTKYFETQVLRMFESKSAGSRSRSTGRYNQGCMHPGVKPIPGPLIMASLIYEGRLDNHNIYVYAETAGRTLHF